MKKVFEKNTLRIYEYNPTIGRPFLFELEPLTLMRRIRFLIDLKYGYRVYYLYKEESVVGYCTITSGKNSRFWFANSNDIIVGPYFIKEEYRGNNYSTMLVMSVLNDIGLTWEKAYVYILNTNTPSIHTTQRVGGHFLFNVHNTPYRKLIKDKNGEYSVFVIEGEKHEES